MSPSFFKPKQTINRSSNDNLIGDLLVKAHVISRSQLDECVRLAGSKRLHLGQMLIMSGYITPRDLQAAVDAQSSLREKAVEEPFAIKCLQIACKSERSFNQVVSEQTAQQEEDEANTDWTLGHLLFEAEAVNKEQLDAAVQRSYATGIPMGRILVLNNAIDEMLLSRSLDVMVKLRDGSAEREEAVEAIKTVIGAAVESPATKALLLPPTGKKIRLGELMLRAGVMSEADVLNAVELGLTYKVIIGQIMVEQGYVSPDVLNGAVELQTYVENGQINDQKAVETLSAILRDGGDVMSRLGDLQAQAQAAGSISFEKLLTLARIVSSEQIEEAFSICRQTPEALSKILRLTGFIDESLHDSVIRCHQLMQTGGLSKDEALVALDYYLNKNEGGSKTLDDVLSELGWTGSSEDHAPIQVDKSVITPAAPTQAAPQPAQDTAESGGFNLLEHFGLSGDAEGQPEGQAQESAPETPVEDEDGWANRDESGEVPVSDPGAASLTERLMEQADAAEGPSEAATTPLPSESNTRLASILDEMADEDTGQMEAVTEEQLANAQPEPKKAVSGNGQDPGPGVDLAAMLDREASQQEIPVHEPEPAAEEPAKPKKFDRSKLKELEKTVAPSALKMDVVLTAPQEDGGDEKQEAVSAAMYRLAESYFEQADYDEAQKTYEKILAIKQKQLGAQSPGLVDDLNKLAEVLWVQGDFRGAEPFVRRSVAILESAQPMDMLKLSDSVRTLAGLYFQQGKYEPCLPLLEHALMMKRMELGEEHKEVGGILKEYAKLLKKLGRKAEADQYYQQSKAILAKNK